MGLWNVDKVGVPDLVVLLVLLLVQVDLLIVQKEEDHAVVEAGQLRHVECLVFNLEFLKVNVGFELLINGQNIAVEVEFVGAQDLGLQ